MKLVYVREAKSRGYTVLGIDEGEGARAYTVPVSIYSDIGAPICGASVSEDAFSRVAYADEVFRATKKALSLLSFSDNNKRTLRAKLRRAGFSPEASDEAVAEMVRDGYVNEGRQLERLILSEVKTKLLGRARIIPKLAAKGYSKSEAEETLDRLAEAGEIDFSSVKEELIRRRLGDNPCSEDVKKLLYKHGFSAWE